MNFKLKDYQVITKLHFGTRSTIYEAKKISNGYPVILKRKSKEYPTNEDMKVLQRELEIGSRIDSDYVIKYIGMVNYDNDLVIVEEDFNGKSLYKLIQNSKFTLKEFLSISIGICEGLKKIHAENIIHGDINPSNILYNKESGQVKIIDFSRAVYSSNKNSIMESSNILQGSLKYISPEQSGRMNRIVDYRSDFYSLGITFYEMLTGRLPFEGTDPMGLIYCHAAKKPEIISMVNPSVPKIISDIVMKLIAKNPEERYKSALGLKKDLERCLKQIGKIEEASFELGEYDYSGKLYIPNKLYGRENEVEILMQSFDKVVDGSAELLLIKGSAGIGKSVLVQEAYSSVIQKKGHFIVGKFEQFQNDIPYSAIIQALENFIDQLLVEAPDKLELWRKSILQTVGNNGQVLIDVLPSLKLIIGEQPLIPKLGAAETKNRFNLVFENFMQSMASEEYPLVMFIDDWQWADFASLSFIKMMLMNKSNRHLLVIGAYRDNEVNLLRPIKSMIDELIQHKTITNIIELKELQKKAVQSLLEDTLIGTRKNLSGVLELSSFIFGKTQGNPFFVKQFIKSLYDMGYLWFDYNLLKWCWNTEEISKLNITENVVEMLVRKIETLDSSTIQVLKYGACIGNQFDLQTIALIVDKSLESIQSDLQTAVKEGLILIDTNETHYHLKNNVKFRFIHDRVQQAAYSIISDENKFNIHLQLGQLFLKNSDINESEQLFEVVRQLNAGRKIIADEKEKIKLSRLNLKAGKVAKSSSAYYSAYLYFKAGIELLSSNDWQENYDLTLQLYSEITEATYLISEYAEMDMFAEKALQNARTVIDKIKIYKIKIEALQAQLKSKEALDMVISVLKLMGIDIPVEPTQSDVEEAFEGTWKTITGIKVEDLANLPSMKDPEKLGAMQILLNSVSVTYKAAPMLMPIVTCIMVDLSIKYGNAPFSPAVYSLYGLTLCSFITNIELGDKLEKYVELAHNIGKINAELVENQNMKPYKATVLDVDNCSVNQWKEHVNTTLKPLMEGYWAGVENGNFEYGGYCLMNYTKHSFYSGQRLEVMEKGMERNIKRLEKIKQGFSVNWVCIFGQLIQNIQGKSKDPLKLIGDFCDEDKLLPILQSIGDSLGMVFFFLSKMIINYHFKNYFAAVEFGKKVEKNLAGASATIDIAIYFFYDSLVRLAVYPTISEDEKKLILEKINKNQAMMHTWSKFAPMNFLHKFYLVEAERLRVEGKTEEAGEYYDKSIDFAKENKYINDEALAYELTGEFYLNKGKEDIAKTYFREARYKYQLWGAISKVKDLENKFLNKFEEDRSIKDISQNIDLFSIMKASQAISSEINLEALMRRLMTVMLENMGAQKGFLVLKRKGELLIEAYADEILAKKKVLTSMPLGECEDIPKTVIRFVERTGENIVFPQKSNKVLFDKDPYIIAKKPQSFFSTAIKLKNEIKGVLYLENNLIEGAFSPDRVKVIEILSAQAAISLENALLYNALEQNMKEQLRESEMRLNVTASSAGIGIWDWKVQNSEKVSNEQLFVMLGYTIDELSSASIDTWNKLVHPEDLKKSEEMLKQCFSKELDFYECEVRMKHKNGDWVWILDRGRVVEWDANEKPLRIAGIYLNITERKRLEDELERAKKVAKTIDILKSQFLANMSCESRKTINEIIGTTDLTLITDRTKELERMNQSLEEANAVLEEEIIKLSEAEAELIKAKEAADTANISKSDFIANISHELRTPIAVILSGIHLIEINIRNGEAMNRRNIGKHIRTMKQNCYRLLRLVNNIIDVTKIDGGFMDLNMKNLNIVNLIEDVTTSVVEYAKEKEINLLFDTDEEDIIMAVDPDKIERIMLNLLSNAIKFTQRNGNIFVNIFNQKTKVIITVEDTGIGIPGEKKEHIFKRFQQIDNTFTRKNEGSGIGLSIVKAFIELHKGSITISSKLGKGSKFVIELPVKILDSEKCQQKSAENKTSLSYVDMLEIEFSDIYF